MLHIPSWMGQSFSYHELHRSLWSRKDQEIYFGAQLCPKNKEYNTISLVRSRKGAVCGGKWSKCTVTHVHRIGMTLNTFKKM
jgi:hypothetical protein